ALRAAIIDSGFQIRQANIFDKQHGTFKQFVNDNTAGCDLVLHCWKPDALSIADSPRSVGNVADSIAAFLNQIDVARRTTVYLHVDRPEEVDYRSLYIEWVAKAMLENAESIDFPRFRALVEHWLDLRKQNS